MTSYLVICSFYQKCPAITFFRIKFSIECAMWELSTILLKSKKKKFNWEEFSKIDGQFAKFQPIFHLKMVLDSQKIRESILGNRGG